MPQTMSCVPDHGCAGVKNLFNEPWAKKARTEMEQELRRLLIETKAVS
jgi:hypothetical protein